MEGFADRLDRAYREQLAALAPARRAVMVHNSPESDAESKLLQASVRTSEEMHFDADDFRSAKELLKARILSAELAAYRVELKAPMDRLVQHIDAALTEFEAVAAARPDAEQAEQQ